MPEIREDWDHLDYRNRHAANLIPLQQSANSKGILLPDDNNDTYRVIIRLPGWANKREVFVGKIPSLVLAQKIADALFHFTGSEPVHNTNAYLQIHPLPVNDDLQSFSRREDYLEYVEKIAQGGQENQAKREELREWLHKVVEKVRENHCNDDGQNVEEEEEKEAEAQNDSNTFILVDDALTGGLEMRRNEMDMFDPVEVDDEEEEEEDGESQGNQAQAGLQQDQYAQSAPDTPPTLMRNVLLQERIVSLPPDISADHYLEFLDKGGPSLLDHTQNTDQMLSNKSKILFKLAQDLKVLKPPNLSILGPDFDIKHWGRQKHRILTQLKHEMRVVRSRRFSSEVYVLTLTPFKIILELMAEEFREKMRSGIPTSS